jgi:glycosyltransferase involved in cell wall biosynthesis
MRPRVVALGSTTTRNRIGRVFSLWLTAREAGLDFTYLTVDDGPMWEPLRDHEEFLACVRTAPDLAELERRIVADLGPDTTVLVCKPRPELVRLARRIEDVAPVVVDIDDPELLDPWGDATMLVRAKRIARNGRTPYRFGWTRRAVRSMHVITSNPLLQELYGGHLVPHVRVAGSAPEGRATSDDVFRIGFVGTLREHKGVTELRAATAELARRRDVRLSITAPAPPDAFPWEDWVGHTSLEAGRELLGACDAVAIVSRPGVWGDRQLPVKLIDAMAAGVPTVVTARAPLLWATGGAAVVVRDGSAADMAEALALLADDVRLASTIATAAWRRACDAFTPAAAAPMLLEAVHHAATGRRRSV